MGTAVVDYERSAAPVWGADKILKSVERSGQGSWALLFDRRKGLSRRHGDTEKEEKEMGTAVVDCERSAAPLWGTDMILKSVERSGQGSWALLFDRRKGLSRRHGDTEKDEKEMGTALWIDCP